MNNVTTATSLPSLCRQHGQHGRKCEAQDISWSRTNKQLEAWLRLRPRITGGSAEKLAIVGEASACWVQYITTTAEGGTMYRSREGFSFFLANSHNRREAALRHTRIPIYQLQPTTKSDKLSEGCLVRSLRSCSSKTLASTMSVADMWAQLTPRGPPTPPR